jgi:predicted dehydrogenase
MSEKPASGLSRRTFAKAGAAASFAILSAKTGIAENNGETIKIGLIGCGGRGTGAAVDNLTGNTNMKLVAMADMFPDRLEASRKTLSAHNNPQVASQVDVADDMCFLGPDAYQELLKTDVDMIIHATTPYIRPKHIEAAVNAGKHIFTEKPIAVDPTGVRRFIAAAKLAEEKKLCLVTGLQRRHQKSYVDTMKQIQDGCLGELLTGRAYWCGTLPFAKPRQPEWSDLETRLRNWYAHCWVCGDNIVEQHIHNLDIMNWAFGNPVKVFASGGRAWKHLEDPETYGDLWDHFSCDFEYANGVHVLSMSRHWHSECTQDVSEHVVGTKGVSNCHDLGKDDQNPYVQEHIDLVKAIRGEAPYINEGVRTAESTLTAVMGRMSAYTGKAVTWDEAMNSPLSIVPEVLDLSKSYPVGPVPVPGPAKA